MNQINRNSYRAANQQEYIWIKSIGIHIDQINRKINGANQQEYIWIKSVADMRSIFNNGCWEGYEEYIR